MRCDVCVWLQQRHTSAFLVLVGLQRCKVCEERHPQVAVFCVRVKRRQAGLPSLSGGGSEHIHVVECAYARSAICGWANILFEGTVL